jgi:hypothetical protein
MSVNKNFVVKNGIEVGTNLIVANAATNKVGIGSTLPRIELDVRGSFASTNSYTSGVSTVFTEFNVGTNGEVFTVLGVGGSIGIGTQTPGYLLDVRAPVSTGQTALFVRGDTRVSGNLNIEGDVFLDDITLDQADIATLIVTSSANIVTLNVPTTATVNTGIITNISGSTATYTNITGTAVTSNAYNIGAVSVITNSRELQNITAVDSTTAATIESVIQNAPNIFTDLSVPGISTLGVTSTTQLTARNLNVSGISSLGTLQNLFVTSSGISTLGTVVVSSGVITSTNASDVVYYGDGQFLKNAIRGIGIGTFGTIIGYGATIFDFRGSGIGTVRVGSGIGTVFVENTGAQVSIGTAPPSGAKVGDLWYSMNLGRTFIYYDEVAVGAGSSAFWVDAAPFNMSVLSTLDSILLAPKTATNPSVGFNTDTSTGFFSPGPGQFTVVSTGSSILNVNPSGVNVSGALTATSLDASAGVVTASTLRAQNLTVYNVADAQGPLWARTEAIIGTRNITTNSAEVNIRQGNVDIAGILTANSLRSTNISVSGISTLNNVIVGGSTTALFVNGDARVTGVLTIGQGTITIDGDSKTISVGSSGLFTGNVNGNVNSTGVSTVANLRSTNINATGIVTATTFSGSLSGTATNATNATLAAGTATVNYVTFAQAATGNQPLKTDTGLTYNASTNVLGATVSGSAASWTTGRTIALTGEVTGTSAAFNGTANLSFATTIASGVVAAANLDGAQTGSAPIYGARAWVNFNGTGGVGAQTVRASANITSVSKTATGTYTVNIATDMSDANYSVSGAVSQQAAFSNNFFTMTSLAAGSFVVYSYTVNTAPAAEDAIIVTAAVHR